jgi:hypothetical protein
LAGTLLFDEKIRQTAGLRDVGILQKFNLRAILQRTIVDSSAFSGFSLAEKFAVCAHTTCLPKK